MPNIDMLINYVPGEECRIAIVEDGKLEELYQERASSESHVGNIYKGRVTNVEPSIQAAFIEFGLERNGFLHISDLHPMYFPGQAHEDTEMVGQKTPRRDRPPIQKCLRRGQDILVQVLKEGIGTKGPTLTSYLSIPGRFLVMMPNMERLGVSRKVEDDEARRTMRQMLDELKPPAGFGFIIRTAGIGRTKTDLKRDLAYLQRLWKSIEHRMAHADGVGELYTESDLVIRTIRDVYSNDVSRIIMDDPVAARRARDFLAIASPRSDSKVLVYQDPIPLFHRFGIERQIETIHSRVVPLPSGGSLVIDSTEALVAIDVNSGKSRDNRDADMTAYNTNLEAVDEICRQLRLRDLGGVVVNDLIDMRSMKHRREVEQRFKNNLKRDRARTRTLTISQFGILEMTRQRMRPSISKATTMQCPSCLGSGLVKSPESVVLDVMRRLALAMHRPQAVRLELTVSPDVAFQLLNRKRGQLAAMEKATGRPVLVRVNGGGPIDFIELNCYDERGGLIDLQSLSGLGEPVLKPVDEVEEAGPASIDDHLLDFDDASADEPDTEEEEAAVPDTAEPDTTGATIGEAEDVAEDVMEEESQLARNIGVPVLGTVGSSPRPGAAAVSPGLAPPPARSAGPRGMPPTSRPAVTTGGSLATRGAAAIPATSNMPVGESGPEGGSKRRRRRRGRHGRGGGGQGGPGGPMPLGSGHGHGQASGAPTRGRQSMPRSAPENDSGGEAPSELEAEATLDAQTGYSWGNDGGPSDIQQTAMESEATNQFEQQEGEPGAPSQADGNASADAAAPRASAVPDLVVSLPRPPVPPPTSGPQTSAGTATDTGTGTGTGRRRRHRGGRGRGRRGRGGGPGEPIGQGGPGGPSGQGGPGPGNPSGPVNPAGQGPQSGGGGSGTGSRGGSTGGGNSSGTGGVRGPQPGSGGSSGKPGGGNQRGTGGGSGGEGRGGTGGGRRRQPRSGRNSAPQSPKPPQGGAGGPSPDKSGSGQVNANLPVKPPVVSRGYRNEAQPPKNPTLTPAPSKS